MQNWQLEVYTNKKQQKRIDKLKLIERGKNKTHYKDWSGMKSHTAAMQNACGGRENWYAEQNSLKATLASDDIIDSEPQKKCLYH